MFASDVVVLSTRQLLMQYQFRRIPALAEPDATDQVARVVHRLVVDTRLSWTEQIIWWWLVEVGVLLVQQQVVSEEAAPEVQETHTMAEPLEPEAHNQREAQ